MAIKMRYKVFCVVSLLSIVLYGCGEKTVSSSASNKLEESQNCIDCHSSNTSKITSKFVTEEWKLSAHNLKNKAGCADCHEFDPSHERNNACSGCHQNIIHAYRIKNPDSAGKCAKCHTSGAGFSFSAYDGITNNTLTNHFSTPTLAAYTSGKFKARYVTKNYENNCRLCHNPHDTTSQMNILRQWARSGKGDVTAPPWKDYDFGRDLTRSTSTPGATPANSFGSDCVRCHTSTGHLNYLTNMSIAPAYGGTSKTEGKEVLACNVCHVDYSYARRKVGAVTAFYNKSTVSKMRIRITETYPDIGESNLCLNCHVGRETGEVIKELADPTMTTNKLITPSGNYDFKNASFENSHYLTAGATVFKTSGFEFYSSQYYNNPSYYAHDKIGVSDYKNTGSSGPCVTCHMKPGNHTFLPVAKDNNGNITSLTSTTCNNTSCHNGSMSASELEDQKEHFNAAMDALKSMLQQKIAMYFYKANPYFFTSAYTDGYKEMGSCASNLAVKNWQTGGTSTFTPKQNSSTKAWSCTSSVNAGGVVGTGPNNMGAAFNYNLLYHDFGAFTHNRIYSKRLIYDSISWLYDNDVKLTSNGQGFYSDVETAIQESVLLTDTQKSAACTYLFTGRTYTTYIPKDSRNWRPGSSATSPVY